MTFKKWNTYLGWSVFLIATIVYFITAEPTVSLWDCGEYITAAYKLEVGHPPGAPLFMVLGRLFSLLSMGDVKEVAVWINRLSGLSSSITILFMYWSITMLGKKVILNRKPSLTKGDQIAILVSSFIGALAYTFSESFWFSAVEGEVYAMASLFTAVIFWAILKWDEEMGIVRSGKLASNMYPDRWLLLILFLLGLAIGVHLLGILVVPAIGYVIYFRHKEEVTIKGLLLTGVISIIVLGFIQEIVIPGSVSVASKFEVTFVNSLGLPFFSGTLFFFALIVVAVVYLIRRARRTGNTLLYNITMGFVFLLIGYGSFAVIVIRSNANPPLDENDPENLVTLHAYLKREQYGSAPIFFGQHWNSKQNPRGDWGNTSPFYVRRFVVIKGDQDIKGFKKESDAKKHAKEIGASEVIEKYWETNADSRFETKPTYEQTAFFPRMYNGQDKRKVEGYKSWSGYDASEDKGTEIGSDNNRLPTFGENLTYFFRYQVNWMYFRYFLWNFSGRQNDIQGHGDQMRGNWISGFSYIDNARLGNQDKHAPYFTSENASNNKFFLLPLILGIIGLIFHFYRAPKDAFVVSLVFLFTGLAILVYLNQKPFEPRERDYAYAGSFYFFAMWIGLGVLALYEAFLNFGKEEWKKIGVVAAAGLLFTLFLDMASDVSYPNVLTWLTMLVIGGGALGLMYGLRKVVKSESQGAIVAGVLGLAVPLIMGVQGWDDHDRSDRTFANDLSSNYLESCGPNGILFTNGDNDTFPLWYMQEVENKRVDVRVANLSLMQTDWYTNQMKMKAYTSEPLPIKFREDQILNNAGGTDVVLFMDLLELTSVASDKAYIEKVINLRLKDNEPQARQSLAMLNAQMSGIMPSFSAANPNTAKRLNLLKKALSEDISTDLAKNISTKFTAALEVFSSIRSGAITATSQKSGEDFQKAISDFEASWNYVNIDDAMEFVRDDNNMISQNGTRESRIFPSSGFILKVEAGNAVKSEVINKSEKDNCLKELRFNFDKRYIQREQVMILDILANNDWKRGIYFSSPGAGDVSMALYKRRYLKQNGMNYELSPLADQLSGVHQSKMTENLLEKYAWGKMSKEGVLNDYYWRRHTEQYRQYFDILAEDYLRQVDELENYDNAEERAPGYIEQLRARNQNREADHFQNLKNKRKSILANNKKKAIELIDMSLKVMPVSRVIDHGESRQGQMRYKMGGVEYPSVEDGSLHGYVTIYFRAGAKDKGNKLGLELADQLESTINYYMKSNPKIAFGTNNTDDLFAAMHAYFEISIAAMDAQDGDRSGPLAKRTQANLNSWYNTMLPAQYQKLKSAAEDNGESTSRGSSSGAYSNMMYNAQDMLDAMAVTFGLKKDIAPPAPVPTQAAPAQINSLIPGGN